MLGPQQKANKRDIERYKKGNPNMGHLIPGIANSKYEKARHFYKYYKPTAA